MFKYPKIGSKQKLPHAFEFLGSINIVISKEIMNEIASADLHTPTVHESTDISVSKYLILCFKYSGNSDKVFFECKTRLGKIMQIKSCEASSIFTVIEEFYKKYSWSCIKCLFTSDGTAVMLGRRNGVAVKLKEYIPHLVQQHSFSHREDLGIANTWKEVKLLQDIKTLMRPITLSFFVIQPIAANFKILLQFVKMRRLLLGLLLKLDGCHVTLLCRPLLKTVIA